MKWFFVLKTEANGGLREVMLQVNKYDWGINSGACGGT